MRNSIASQRILPCFDIVSSGDAKMLPAKQLVEMNIGQHALERVTLRDDVLHPISTQRFDWPGLRVEAGINSIAAVDDASGSHHYLSLNLDERPLTMEFKAEQSFRRVVLRRGAAWICPANEPLSRRLDSDFRYARVSIDPVYFDRLTGQVENPTELRRTYGVTE